jgi:hypothetical protein
VVGIVIGNHCSNESDVKCLWSWRSHSTNALGVKNTRCSHFWQTRSHESYVTLRRTRTQIIFGIETRDSCTCRTVISTKMQTLWRPWPYAHHNCFAEAQEQCPFATNSFLLKAFVQVPPGTI